MEETALQRITAAHTEGAATLDLSSLTLKEIPESLRDLKQLRTLKLENNELTALPEWLGMLGVIQADFLTIHQKISGLGEIEELELENTPGIYVPVRTLREDGEIREELDEADIILFLVSSHFLASDYIRGVEVMRAVERADCREVQLAPIILEKVDWELGPFGNLMHCHEKVRLFGMHGPKEMRGMR
jgi:hypothetical protein